MRQLLVAWVLISGGMFAAALPVHFEKKGGSFLFHGASGVASFDTRGVTWGHGNSEVRMSFTRPGKTARPVGDRKLSGKINYLTGGPQNWRTGIEAYSEVRYNEIYPGIGLTFHGTADELEYDFHIAPFADPAAIRLHFSGDVQVRLDPSGDLLAGALRHHKPLAYQIIGSQRRTVSASFFLAPDGDIGLSLGKYDRSGALIIDPVVTYDKSVTDSATIVAMTVDAQGYVYVAGNVYAHINPHPMFVAKLNPDGQDFAYLSYVGGTGNDVARGLALDVSGNVFLAGSTASQDFPTTAGAVQKNLIVSKCSTIPPLGALPITYPCNDGFALKLDSKGATLLYSTLLGGSGDDNPQGIRIDSQGDAWVAGYTTSADFPTSPGAFQNKLKGTNDGFVTLLNPTGTALLQSTFLGGSGTDQINALAADPAGNVYVAGVTTSTDFPVTAGVLQAAINGTTNAFLAKFGKASSAPIYATYYGGSTSPNIRDIQVDSVGNAYLGADATHLGGPTVPPGPVTAITKIDPQGSSVLFQNTMLQGASSLSVDDQGQVTALGIASLRPPLLPNALSTCAAPFGTFLLRLEADGQTVRYGSYAGSPFTMPWFLVGFGGVPNLVLPSRGVVVDGASDKVYLAIGSNIEKQDFSQDPPMAATCVIPYADSIPDAIAPGQIVSIYGRNIGPATGVQGVFEGGLQLPFSLGGVTVTFDGTPAPLWYVQANQINAVVPFATVNQTSTKIEITYNGTSTTVVRPMRAASNIILRLNNQTAGINQDGTINSSAHPAPLGSVVTIFSDGGGQTNPPSVDGQIAKSAAPLVLPAHVVMTTPSGVREAEVLYAGAAPNQIAGVVQVNFRIPADLQPGSADPGSPNLLLALTIGSYPENWTASGAIFVSQ